MMVLVGQETSHVARSFEHGISAKGGGVSQKNQLSVVEASQRLVMLGRRVSWAGAL